MPKRIQIFFLFFLLINLYISQNYDSNEQMKKLRFLEPVSSNNISKTIPNENTNKNTNTDNPKNNFHIKLSQSVFSDETSKNYYFTTLYIGENKKKQTYLIDTSSGIMTSTCSHETGLNPQKLHYIYQNKSIPKLKCDSKVCDILPANVCHDKNNKDEKAKKLCSYDSSNNSTEGVKGYYVKDIAYLEEEAEYISPIQRRKYHSYAMPIGCSTDEFGKFKDVMVDGVLGVNNSPNSFIGLLYKLKIIKQDIFSLCFGLRGGYMSLGQIDEKHHLDKDINYIPMVDSTSDYLIKINCISVGNESNPLKMNKTIAQINSGETITYLPEEIFDKLIKQFNSYCSTKENCGKFENKPDFGYCASFPDRETLYNAIYRNWPEISIHLDNNTTYIWKPFNYYIYHHPNVSRLACLGFTKSKSNNIILGTNFFRGYDIIFDRKEKKIGFVKADCSRGNHLWRRGGFNRFYTGNELEERESVRKFGILRYNRTEEIDFIRGTNSELNFGNKFRIINYILLSGSIIILIIVAVAVISLLVCNKKVGLKYEEPDVVIEPEVDNENDN